MLDILYEDGDLIFCIKKAGIISEAGEGGMVELLSKHTKSTVYAVHRLDKGVGGLMVYAKSQKAAAVLSAQIQNGCFVKEYLAITRGRPETENGTLTDLLFHDRRANKSYVVAKKRAGVKEARLDFDVKASAETEKGALSLIHVRLHTGRTHQIRVQFSSRRLPLYGDGKYGGRSEKEGIALWSHRIRLSLPSNGEKICIEAKPCGSPWSLFEI